MNESKKISKQVESSDSDQNLCDYNVNNPSTEMLHFVVSEEQAGMRFDQALANLLPEYSRSRLQDWVEAGQACLNQQIVSSKQKVWAGDKITVTPQVHPAEQPYLAQDIALDILFEDESLLIINKPVGLVVHPGSGNWEGTLLNALLYHHPPLEQIPRAGIVHRLDKDTSGLLVVAKTLTAQTNLVRQLQARTVKREYLAVCYGELNHHGSIDQPIGRHPTQRVKMAVVPDGKPAVTHYFVEEKLNSCTLVRCRLETGRTHQIRVHMAYLKHPLVGDGVYLTGVPRCAPELRQVLSQFPRQALHATRLALNHPVTDKLCEWHVAMPDDMVQLLQQIREFS